MKSITYDRLSYEERVEISIHLRMGFSQSWIARTLGRNKSTISREARRCEIRYFAPEAQVIAAKKYRRNQRKLDKNSRLREFVLCGLRKRWSPDQISKTLPQQMKQSLTYDRGIEMSEHRLFTKNTKMKVYFCHPYSPWERGTCENTNGLIRDYFPKGTDFNLVSKEELKRVQDELNERPRRTLDYRTPKEVINKEILQFVALET